ncbi:putative RING/U-box superfamily protein [Tripterygium wilfordii]|uniref:Putative RING/U-box superfamily protein n=1 Tax=Tripterygium wilfordii TaxID=458696 RepID=A0A7J7D9L5_TRIWF|nr:E3 ubiquitin protein ligase RIE1-like [Tripterygium wilfordii]KAF5742939.1 putative RING/U-box superfamily protein [Tripterygium wilfordii]
MEPSPEISDRVEDAGTINSSDLTQNENARTTSSIETNTGNSYTVFLFWHLIKLIYTVGEITAAIVVLVVSRRRHEKPPDGLFIWVVVYAAICAASLPILFNRYFLAYPRLYNIVDNLKFGYEISFAIWFGVGNYWILGDHSSSSSKAPSLYRLSVVFLTFGYIKYATPFFLCSIVLCLRGRLSARRAAPTQCINALPTYKFKLLKNGSSNARDGETKIGEDGVVAAGTERERVICSDDAVCCICLARYEDSEDLKELPCSHLFHGVCVDKWLMVRALCPICKQMVRVNNRQSSSSGNSSQV